MTIIVTGGAGFIGSNFIFYMLDKHPEDRIVCVDKLTYAGNLSTLESVMDKPNFRFVKADICDRKAIYDLFEEEHPDMVVNFAAESHVDRSIENPEVFLQTNILGTQVMLDACRKYGIQRYALRHRPTKIHSELGWLPETKFADGIDKTIDWYLTHRDWWENIINGEYQHYYERMYGNR